MRKPDVKSQCEIVHACSLPPYPYIPLSTTLWCDYAGLWSGCWHSVTSSPKHWELMGPSLGQATNAVSCCFNLFMYMNVMVLVQIFSFVLNSLSHIIIKFSYNARSDRLKQCTLSEYRCTEELSRH